MKRHDTHLLSDESEKGEKEEDAHEYIFNSSKNSSKNSEEQYIPQHNQFLYIDELQDCESLLLLKVD